MPGINGFDVLVMFKDNPRFLNVPIVAYTVHTAEIHLAQEDGFDKLHQ